MVVIALAMVVAAFVADHGTSGHPPLSWLYQVVMLGAGIAVLARAVRRSDQRLAWSLIGGALIAWCAGDVYYYALLADSPSVPYPSLSDAGYLALYVLALTGLRLLGARAPGPRAFSWGSATVLLGLATLWSWLVFSGILGSVAGGTAAVATTLAYPLLDLVLLISSLLLLASRDSTSTRSIAALALGFGLLAITDSAYASEVARGTYHGGTVLEAFWPMAAILIAIGAWIAPGGSSRPALRERGALLFTGLAVVGAIGVQLVDHFTGVDTVTVVLSTVTLLVAGRQLLFLHRERASVLSSVNVAEKLRSASAEAALDCIISIDGRGRVCAWNGAATATFGYSSEDALGSELAELIIPPEIRGRHRQGIARLTEGGEAHVLGRRIEVMAMHAHGEQVPVELAITQVQEDPLMFTGFVRDISERRLREEENERLAAIVRSSKEAILSKDLNGVVTAWNQGAEKLYGFAAGEAVGRPLIDLIVPAERRNELDAATDSVLSQGPTAFETQRLTKQGVLIDVSLQTFPIRNLAGEVIGVSTTAHDVTEQRRLEEKAERDKDGTLWRSRIRTALSEGGFEFWAQPVVDARTGAVDHQELLLRMDLDGETVTPNHFLPHAENSELIAEIDRWAVRNGIEYARTFPVAINLSARSLSNKRLMDEIRTKLADPSLARNVTFEITESAAAENLEAAHGLVAALTKLGCGVSLDDFGTGYGSFTYLKHLPVTELKIDIDFVRGITDSAANLAVVKSLIAVARNFGMRTVAEGVENGRTLDLLRELGVDLVQGYFTGHPAQIKESNTPSRPDRSSSQRPQLPTPADAPPGSPIDVVQRLFAAIDDGDVPGVLAVVHPEVAWSPTAWSGARTFHGTEGMREWLLQFGEDIGQLTIELLGIERRGDHVTALGNVFDRRRGLDFTTRVSWVFFVSDGLIRAGQSHASWNEARSAARRNGLEPPPPKPHRPPVA
jgi:PAS domain S-box-containing protein